MMKAVPIRIRWLFYIFLVLWLLVIGRLFYLQIIQYDHYKSRADKQYITEVEVLPRRGTIYFTDLNGKLFPGAVNKSYFQLYVVPKDILDKETTLKKLVEIIPGIDVSGARVKMDKAGDPFELLEKKVSKEDAEKIRSLDLVGVGLKEEQYREYPFGSFAGRVLGYVGPDTKTNEKRGYYGIEGYYEELLRGVEGYFKGEKDPGGIWISVSEKEKVEKKDGADVYLTVDYNIQRKAEEILSEMVKKWEPESAAIVVEEPSTGAIRAMAMLPGFDPNSYGEVKDFHVFQNELAQDIFEPGSIMKPITASIAINEGKVTENTTFEDMGILRIGGYKIENFKQKKYGVQSMTNVIEQSINTGAVFMQQQAGKEAFARYLEKFGFGVKTGIDVPGEIRGSIANLKNNRDIEYATASFGQGISATPIGMIQSLSAIANKGDIMRPHVVSRIIDASGVVTETAPSVLAPDVITEETARVVSRMMASTVKNTYLNAKMSVDGYTISAKTGTAQIPNPDGRGYLGPDQTIQSLVSFFPSYDPRYILFFKMNKPKGSDAAGNSLPVYVKNMIVFLIQYAQIPPERMPEINNP